MTNLAAAVELKACPFCGGRAILENVVIEAYIYCDKCKARLTRMHGPNSDDGIENCVNAWNTRPPVAGLADFGLVAKWRSEAREFSKESDNANTHLYQHALRSAAMSLSQCAAELETAAREFLGKVDG